MYKSVLAIFVLMIFAVSTFGADYYAATNGTSTGDGSIGNPWDLQTAFNKTSQLSGNRLFVRGGTYVGKFTVNLNNATIQNYPTEVAVIDGFKATTLTSAIDASQTTLQVASTAGLFQGGDEIAIDGEVLKFCSPSNSTTLTGCLRGASGTIGGASSHASGATVVSGGTQLLVAGQSNTIIGLEVKNSSPLRDGLVYPEIGRGSGIWVIAPGNNIINNVVHDNLDGIVTSSATSNTLLQGNVSYNNGMTSGIEGLGHGYYLENSSGYSKVYENISLNNFNLGAQYFGQTASYVGGDSIGDIFANNGSPLEDVAFHDHYNLIVGTANVLIPSVSLDHMYFFHKDWNAYNAILGYGSGVTTGSFTNSYFVGGLNNQLEIANTQNFTGTGNTHYSAQTGFDPAFIVVPQSRPNYNINNNTYYNGATADRYGIVGVGHSNFAWWKSMTGFDANSTATSTAMPDTVIVRANSQEIGRANIVVYAPSAPSSINVNLSTSGLVSGQDYVIKNAFNWTGPNVYSGTYTPTNSTITLPLNGTSATVATPVGMSYTPITTCPQFCAFVIVPSPRPTATTASISGKVWKNGIALANANVQFSNGLGQVYSARTNTFGNYTVTGMPVGVTYVGTASAKGYTSISRSLTLNNDVTGFDFTN